ncbi:MAG: hypothetical protein MIO92_13335, partial [Methanosarcinaceae archaeon]|nr:hypothetical protein [Methanosarcinaceae archaeon]
MKRFLLLAMAVLFSVTASNCKGTGDVGSVECREVQLAVQSTVSDGEPYKNHWEMMKTVNHLLSEEIKIGKITWRCAACIKQQFAQGIAIDEQKPCGEDAAAQTVLNFATNEFSKMREKIDLEDKTPANAKFIGNHVEVASQKWAYVLDYSGQQIFRPINAYSHLKASFSKDISRVVEEWKDANVPQSKIDEARLLTSKTLGV